MESVGVMRETEGRENGSGTVKKKKNLCGENVGLGVSSFFVCWERWFGMLAPEKLAPSHILVLVAPVLIVHGKLGYGSYGTRYFLILSVTPLLFS